MATCSIEGCGKTAAHTFGFAPIGMIGACCGHAQERLDKLTLMVDRLGAELVKRGLTPFAVAAVAEKGATFTP